jgi:hypothetical protein
MNKNLAELYAEHKGKVSDKWSLYLEIYDRIFKDMRQDSLALLEIGIQNGGSLEIWARFFPFATSIIGCDINLKCLNLKYSEQNVNLVVGDANEAETCRAILSISNAFDIVIDDGSHRSSDIIKSFCLYFPSINPGGLFIAEDLHCSYWAPFEGGLRGVFSSIEFFKRLVDILNFEHWTTQEQRFESLQSFFDKYGCTITDEDLSSIHSIEFINSMCIIRKKNIQHNVLGKRIVVGSDASIVSEVAALNNLPYKLDPNLIEKQGFFKRLMKYFR